MIFATVTLDGWPLAIVLMIAAVALSSVMIGKWPWQR